MINNMLISNWILKNDNRIIKLVVLILLSFFQFYWAESKYSATPSSACLDCSFIEDLLLFTTITVLFLGIVSLILKRLKYKSHVKIAIQIVLLIIMWFWVNSQIFIEREASWSTYSSTETLFNTLNDSVISIIFCSIIYLTVNYIIDKHRT